MFNSQEASFLNCPIHSMGFPINITPCLLGEFQKKIVRGDDIAAHLALVKIGNGSLPAKAELRVLDILAQGASGWGPAVVRRACPVVRWLAAPESKRQNHHRQ
eukprot:scaffold204129_cov19-Prasinocladus_malaysianus.AAC.1